MDAFSRIPTFWIVVSLLALTGARAWLSMAERGERRDATRFRSWGEILESFVVAVVIVFLVVRPFIAQAFYIPSRSMTPTLAVSDRIIVNKFSYRFREPARHDVVVFRAPTEASRGFGDGEEKDFIKRVIGTPGDVVEVHGGVTYVNGKPDHLARVEEIINYDLAPVTVPKGKLFVLGDNRNHSNDSHCWGLLDRSLVIGKAEVVFWPPGRAGGIR
jgi:signal peptidase I